MSLHTFDVPSFKYTTWAIWVDIPYAAITKKSGSIFRAGIFLDFVRRSGTTRGPRVGLWGVRAEGQTKSS